MNQIEDLSSQVRSLELASFRQYFGFRTHPFSDKIEGSKAILLADQKVARDEIRDAIKDEHEFIIFTGPAGIGKTIVMENVISGLQDQYQTILVDKDQILTSTSSIATEKIRFIVDNANELTRPRLKDLLQVIEAYKLSGSVVQTIFVARPNFLDLIHHFSLCDFCDKIGASIVLYPLESNAIEEYMAMRLNLAGISSSQVVVPRAGRMIARASEGIPSRLNFLATGALKNAVSNKHHLVKTEDADLAIKHPNVSPEEIYGWGRKHRKAIICSVSGTALLLLVGFAATKPWFSHGVKIAYATTQGTVSTLIDFFADHSNEESPQITLTQTASATPVIMDDATVQHSLNQRSKLIEELDKESRTKQANTTDASSSPTEQPMIPEVQLPPVLPELDQPIQPQRTVIASATTPPQERSVPSKTVPEPPDTHAEHASNIPAPHHSSLPSFCAKMHPTTQASREYMKKVCVKANKHGDLYFGYNQK